MRDFVYHNATRILFGKTAEEKLGKEVKAMGSKVLLHYGGGSIKKSGLYGRVTDALKKEGVPFVELGGVKPNPRLALVEEGIALCKKEGVDCILAVGGGSVIDSAKAIGVGARIDEEIWPYFLRERTVTATLPVGSVLTIPAAGSESSSSSVITKEEGLLKRGMNSPVIRPVFAVINPELTYTLPAYQMGCGCTDILAHMMERYFTNEPHVDVSDRMLEGIMRSVLCYAPLACREPENYDAKAEICWAGTLAHNGLLDCGRVADWGTHGIEHEISALYDIAHGAGLAIIFPAWMRYVYKRNIPRFVQFATRVMGVDLACEDPGAIIEEGIARLEGWYHSIGMPIRLTEAGIGGERLREMAEKVVLHTGGVKGETFPLNAGDIEEIYKLAL